MKAKDLMIGNWVKSRGKIEQVTSVYEGYICTDTFEDSHDYYFEPIPLTPEILEKNKLLKQNGFELDFSRHHRLKVILLWTDAKGISRPQITFYLPKPRYVHELQHALRLCGIEKEIVL